MKDHISAGKILFLFVLCLFALSCLNGGAWAQADDGPIKTLMIIGGGPFHDYPTQKEQLREGITDRIGNIDFTIDHNEGESEEDMSFKFESQLTNEWAQKYDLVLYNNCNLDMGDAEHVEEIMAAHAKYEVPAVLLHCPMHLHRTTTTKWYDFTGAISYQHEVNRTPFTVETVEPNHPIMANFPNTWRTPEGELYMPVELKDNATPLARAYGDEGGEFFPVAWTHKYKGVRVFSSTLGHHNATMGADVNLNLVAAGLLWAAGKLQDDGTPAPGYSGERGLGWISLWDGETLKGWRASETTDWGEIDWFDGDAMWPTFRGDGTESFRIEDGNIVAGSFRSHLFYEGRVDGGDFKNFELKAEVRAGSGANSGIFFHTRSVEEGISSYGYEADINAVAGDGNQTGDINPGRHATRETSVSNGDYFDYYIRVDGDEVTVKVNGETVINYTEPEDRSGTHRLDRGTIALQAMSGPAHFRDLQIRVWPD